MRLNRVTVLAMFLVSTVGVTDTLLAQPGRGNGRGNDRGNGRSNDRDDDRRDDRSDKRGRESGRNLFSWSGVVDREVTLVMRGRDLQVRGERGVFASRADRPRTTGALPRTDGDVRVRVLDGRGQVVVLQQPSARNNYTTIVRVRDPQGGDDRYRISASWEPDARGAQGRGDDRGRDNRGDRDDDWGWGRDNDDDRSRSGTTDRGGIWGVLNGGAGRDNDRNPDSRYNQGVRFTGVIDDVVDLRIQGRRVEVVERSGGRTRDVRSTFDGVLPSQPVTVQIARADGRGNVRVVQQPSRQNGYTAIVRVEDRSGGAARYDLNVRW